MFPELDEVLFLKESFGPHAKIEILDRIEKEGNQYPIVGFSLGSPAPDAPTLGIIGGIHGLEKIGTWVALAFLRYLHSRIQWDESLHHQLQRMRVFFVPLVNPVGMKRFNRSNGNGVDLMRNAPVDSDGASFLVGGHHYSRHLPWYRGNLTKNFEGMEKETQALYRYVHPQIKNSPCSVILDLHSGFGLNDQIWFPYARTKEPFPHLAEVHSLSRLIDRVHPHHVYRFEPQSKHYTTHGDLWDYLYEQLLDDVTIERRVFLPLTLEMGSWNWVKKNPTQIFNAAGAFNPMKPHRYKRALRRHLPLFDFLCRAVSSPKGWWPITPHQRDTLRISGIDRWYR